MKKSSLTLFFIITIFSSKAQKHTNVNQRQQDSVTNARNERVLGKPLQTFVASGDNGVINNDSLKGKVTFINMWFAACAPCMAEMPALNKLYDTLKYYPEFQFVSISPDNQETIKQIEDRFTTHFKVYHLDDEGCFQLNQGLGYPTSIILNEKGQVTFIHSGGYTDSAKVWQFIFKDEIYPAIVKELK